MVSVNLGPAKVNEVEIILAELERSLDLLERLELKVAAAHLSACIDALKARAADASFRPE